MNTTQDNLREAKIPWNIIGMLWTVPPGAGSENPRPTHFRVEDPTLFPSHGVDVPELQDRASFLLCLDELARRLKVDEDLIQVGLWWKCLTQQDEEGPEENPYWTIGSYWKTDAWGETEGSIAVGFYNTDLQFNDPAEALAYALQKTEPRTKL